MPPGSNKVQKSYIKHKGQGHNVIDFGDIWKGIISGVVMQNISLYLLWFKSYREGKRTEQTGQKQHHNHLIWRHNKIENYLDI